MLFIHEISDWFLSQSLLEVFGVITGLLCVLLAALNIIWNWPLAIISVCIYIVIFFEAKLYADMGLQVYFLIMNIYGWYYWSRKKDTGKKKPVVHVTFSEIIFSVIGIVVFTGILGFALHKETDASFPFIDSFCTACSLIAQVFLARKVLENWLIWIFVDVIYTVVYLLKGLHLTAGMYFIYIIIAILGYADWKKSINKSSRSNLP